MFADLLLPMSVVVGMYNSPEQPPEHQCLIESVVHEARGESLPGQFAVLEVIDARVESDRFPNTVCSVVYQPNQFSWTAYETSVTKEQELAAAQVVFTYLYQDVPQTLVYGSTYFINANTVGAIPSWVHALDEFGQIGEHTFYGTK